MKFLRFIILILLVAPGSVTLAQERAGTSGGSSLSKASLSDVAGGTNDSSFVTPFGVAAATASSGTFVTHYFGGPLGTPKLVWMQDDFPADIDDMFALTLAFVCQDSGLFNIAAMIGATDRGFDSVSIPLQDCWARYYGYPTILQAQVQGGYPGTASWWSLYANQVVSIYQHSALTASNALDALTAERIMLANSPPHSVWPILGGPTKDISDLWYSPADSISPLTGAQLMSNAIAEVVVVSGWMPATTDINNFAQFDNWSLLNTAAWVFTNMPGINVTYCGLEMGQTIVGGQAITNRLSEDIMNYAYHNWALYTGNGYVGRQKWTDLAVMYVAFGTNAFGTNAFTYQTGQIALGQLLNASSQLIVTNSWITNSTGTQKFLIKTQPDAFYLTNLDAMLGRPANFQMRTVGPTANWLVDPSKMIVVSNGLFIGTAAVDPSIASPDTWWNIDKATNTVDNTLVALMPDAGSLGNPLVTNGLASGPYWRANQKNSHAALQFNQLSATGLKAPTLLSSQAPCTFYALIYSTNVANVGTIFGGTQTGNLEFRLNATHLDLVSQQSASIATDTATLAVNTWYAVMATYDGTTFAFYTNNVAVSTGSNAKSLGGAFGTYLGSEGGSVNPFGGYMISPGKVNRVVTGLERTNIFNYLMSL